MAGRFFKKIFGREAKGFNSINEIDRFIEKVTKKKINVKNVHSSISSRRGSIFKIVRI